MSSLVYYLSPVLAVAALSPTMSSPGDPPGGVQVRAAAKRIDNLLVADMKRAKLSPNPIASDAAFLRRAYLTIVGRIPTSAESLRFLDSQSPDKRGALVDQLLESPGYDSHMFSFWADLLRVKTRLTNQVSGEPFMHFIKESIASDKPYDEFVREMVAAEGPAHARGNGATGLLMRDRGMQLDSVANTVRVFLGTRLECAQCHNHPFDKWKQKDFYQMAAFTGGLGYRTDLQKIPGASAVRKLFVEVRRDKDRNAQRALGQMMRQVTNGLTGSGTGVIQLPKDYQYDDAKPRDLVQAHALFGSTPKIEYKNPTRSPRAGERSRRRMTARQRRMEAQRRRNRGGNRAPEIGTRNTFAEWLTSPKNPRFTKVIANRLWRWTMGRGLIEPVDNITDSTVASNPALMRYLEKLMVDCGYDLKVFLKVLLHTEAFQRDAEHKDVPSDQKFYFQGPVLRRMTAEQVWDSMLTFVVPEVDARLQKPDTRAKFVYDNYDRLVSMSEEELRAEVDKLALRYKDPQKFRAEQRRRQQAIQQKRRQEQVARQRQIADLRRKSQPIYRQLIKARRAKDTEKIAALKAELKALGIDPDQAPARRSAPSMGARMRARGRGRNAARLVRASDQPQPAPNGHFLRNFGQSDREQIEASHTEANVPQVLALLNGFIEKQVLANQDAVLMRTIRSTESSEAQVRQAFLSILSREPRGRELAMWSRDIETQGRGAVQDLVWTLVNTHEFRFIR